MVFRKVLFHIKKSVIKQHHKKADDGYGNILVGFLIILGIYLLLVGAFVLAAVLGAKLGWLIFLGFILALPIIWLVYLGREGGN